MRTLLLMRHAKSSHDHAGLTDHDRPLNDRGRRDAPRMGARLTELGLSPNMLLCSTAERARETAEQVVAVASYGGPVLYDARLYLAAPEALLRVVSESPEDAIRVLVVGHNPGMEQVVAHLTGAALHMPTAAVAQIELPIDRWRDAMGTKGRLAEFLTPKDE